VKNLDDDHLLRTIGQLRSSGYTLREIRSAWLRCDPAVTLNRGSRRLAAKLLPDGVLMLDGVGAGAALVRTRVLGISCRLLFVDDCGVPARISLLTGDGRRLGFRMPDSELGRVLVLLDPNLKRPSDRLVFSAFDEAVITFGELVAKTGLPRATISKALDRLMRRQWVKKLGRALYVRIGGTSGKGKQS
jgi:hypothetical protein